MVSSARNHPPGAVKAVAPGATTAQGTLQLTGGTVVPA